MKPILFNTEMVRALLEGRKTATRRVVKPRLKTECSHGGQHEFIRDVFIDGFSFTGFVCKKCGYGVCGPHFKSPIGTSWIRPPYRPGDILYVRETFFEYRGHFYYKADGKHDALAELGIVFKWRPSIHMPREAARIFLKVTGVRAERLREITLADACKEGCERPMQFDKLWNSTIKPTDLALYGWDANPYVWVIEFERISREEAQIDGRG